jgi:phospholipase C
MGDSPAARSGRKRRLRPYLAVAAAVALGAGAAAGATAASASTAKPGLLGYRAPQAVPASVYLHASQAATPIKHLVVIFDENVSFDHYFGTYPYAANTDGTTFHAKPGTPTVNGLYTSITPSGPTGSLLTSNPNAPYNPQRLTHSEALTSDQNHGYAAEEKAEDGGKMDAFIQNTQGSTSGCGSAYCPPGIVLDYYDGNTVTALWNYAQYYSMSDNNWDTTFGPSTPGALNVISGNTQGASALIPSWATSNANQPGTSGAVHDGSMNGDVDPYYDTCSDGNHASPNALGVMSGQNIGDLLNTKNITWGWFQGGFAPSSTDSIGAICATSHTNIGGTPSADYSPHHNPFQYYASTANPDHIAPSSLAAIGHTDQANHQYDLSYFSDALNGTGGAKLPAVSYLKAAEYQDGHPGYSDPLDEQTFLVNTINSIEKSKYWPSTAIVVTYDDSDGWYDHQAPTIISGSNDATQDAAICTSVAVTVGTTNDRCGYSQRLPLVVISPWTRENYVSSNLTNTASVVKFIEDNWLHGERIANSYDAVSGSLDAPGGVLDFRQFPHLRPLILNPTTGAVVSGGDGWSGQQ